MSPARRIVIITGLSGSGKSAALKAFEDMGYYCVDNLPLELLHAFVELTRRSAGMELAAIGLDMREQTFTEQFPPLIARLKAADAGVELLFFEAADPVLVRRYSETRRPHPLARETVPLTEGLRREREALAAVRKLADRIIDTSEYTVHDLRQAVERHYAGVAAGRPMVITVITFGYKYGIPYDVDLLFDLRFLPNPYFVPELKPFTGEDPRVRSYVMASPDSGEFLARLLSFLEYLLPRYRAEGKSYLTVGFGCTGGRHRSVTMALLVAERLRQAGYDVNVKHRDIGG